VKGYRSNWCVFLRDDVVHVCRVGGEEFYRFKLDKINNETYTADTLETYASDAVGMSAKLSGQTVGAKQYQSDFKKFAIEETAGLLSAYFGIST